jgi:DNA repair protein RadC
MDAMVDGRALTGGDRGKGARARIGGAGWTGTGAAGASRDHGLAEAQRDPRFGPGQGSLDAIERVDHSSVSSTELLELLLHFGKSAAGADGYARALMDHFGSLGAVLAADPNRLVGLLAGDQASVFLLKIVRVAVKMTLREPLEDRPVISSASSLMDYLSVTMRHEPTEATRVLFLDRKNALIKDETLHRGTVDHTPLYPREVLRRVIETGASAIILVHNHPSGDPSPSKADIAMTKELIAALGTIGGVLHDHVIVGRNKELSLRKCGLI